MNSFPPSAHRGGAAQTSIRTLPDPEPEQVRVGGGVRSAQEAELQVPSDALEELWHPKQLERLARAYWRHLTQATAGAVKVLYEPSSRTVVLLTSRLPLLRFGRPTYLTGPDFGRVTWRIERGLLVSRRGRGRGYLQITVRRQETGAPPGEVSIRVRTEVANFYPTLRGAGRFPRIGALIYNATQLRIHVWITRGYLRSLGRLGLPPGPVDPMSR